MTRCGEAPKGVAPLCASHLDSISESTRRALATQHKAMTQGKPNSLQRYSQILMVAKREAEDIEKRNKQPQHVQGDLL